MASEQGVDISKVAESGESAGQQMPTGAVSPVSPLWGGIADPALLQVLGWLSSPTPKP